MFLVCVFAAERPCCVSFHKEVEILKKIRSSFFILRRVVLSYKPYQKLYVSRLRLAFESVSKIGKGLTGDPVSVECSEDYCYVRLLLVFFS